MSVVTDYKVIVGNYKDFCTEMRSSLEEGWQPQGGVLAPGSQFVQAMVKIDTSAEESLVDSVNEMRYDMVNFFQNWNDHQSYARHVKVEK